MVLDMTGTDENDDCDGGDDDDEAVAIVVCLFGWLIRLLVPLFIEVCFRSPPS